MTPKQIKKARAAAVHAAMLGYQHASAIHYTQGSQRWQGIADTRYSARGQYPNYADCSGFATWCLWNGLFVLFKKPDVVNGLGWKGGYTGTMLQHGMHVPSSTNLLPADCVIYGPRGSTGAHVAIVVGKRNGIPMVVSHGSESGPYYLPWNYRSDIEALRRYIH